MKRIYLVRHANASCEDPGSPDIERPLSDKGREDAPMMAEVLKSLGIKPDAIISSSAVRAMTTAKNFAKVFDYADQNIIEKKDIYQAEIEDLFELVQNIDNKHSDVLVFGHNPGLTKLANKLTDDYSFELTPCGICGVEFEIDDWQDVINQVGKQILLDMPDNHH